MYYVCNPSLNECLELINSKNVHWPNYDETLLVNEKINIVVQINGKKRGLIETKRNISEKEVLEKIMLDQNIKKYIENKQLKRKIFVTNKLINIII